jgi:hypothetical protein
VSGRKTDWTINMLKRLGDSPERDDYVFPANGDVWEFLEKVVKWITNPSRKGTS